MATLIVNSNSVGNPLSLNLSTSFRAQPDEGMDPADPQFAERIWGRSLLKEGATLALEQLTEKELLFPLALKAPPQGPWTNEVPNPSFEYDTLGGAPAAWYSSGTFLGAGATLTVVSTQAQNGSQSCQVVTTATANRGLGIALSLPSSGQFLAGVAYTFQIWLKGNAGGEAVALLVGTATDNHSQNVTLTAGWAQYSVVWTPTANETSANAAVRGTAASIVTFFADTAMVTTGATQYVDGDQLGGQWNGVPGNSTSSGPVCERMVQQINQAINTPGATVTWQDSGRSQATVFDLLSGQCDIEYSYFRGTQSWLNCKLRMFTQPLGRTAGPRAYAAASSVGPILYIAPSSYQLANVPWAGSISYVGNPGLAGDAPTELVMSVAYASAGAAGLQFTNVLVSKLPDSTYVPMSYAQTNVSGWTRGASDANAPDGFRWTQAQPGSTIGGRASILLTNSEPTQSWAGQHRLFAFARASGTWAQLVGSPTPWQMNPVTASIGPPGSQYQLYDLGTISFRASEPPSNYLLTAHYPSIPSVGGVGSNCALDLGGLMLLPDNATWFAGPSAGAYAAAWNPGQGNLIIDDTLGDQFTFSAGPAASPVGLTGLTRITQWSRGLVPRPDPRDGIPYLAIVAIPGSGLANPFPLLTAQVMVQERTRYILP